MAMSKAFWETMCGLIQIYRIAFYLSVAIMSLAVVSLTVIQTGTATYYITFLTIAINACIALGSGYLIRTCSTNAEQ